MTRSSIVSLVGVLFGLGGLACGGAVDGVPTSQAPGDSDSNRGADDSSSSSPTPSQPPAPNPSQNTPPSPPIDPAFGSSLTGGGCDDFTLYAPDLSKTNYLVIDAKKRELALANIGDTVTVDLTTTQTSVEVWIDNYAAVPTSTTYCSDAETNSAPPTKWRAVSGKVTFEITGLGLEGEYQVSTKLVDVIVSKPNGSIYRLPQAELAPTLVGWFPG